MLKTFYGKRFTSKQIEPKYVPKKTTKLRRKEKIITIMKRKKNLEKKRKCKIENVNNFSLHLKIEMVIFIIFHQMGILNIRSMWVYIPGLY